MATRTRIGTGPEVTDDDLEDYLAAAVAELEAVTLFARLDVTRELADRFAAREVLNCATAALEPPTANLRSTGEAEQAPNETPRETLLPFAYKGSPLSLLAPCASPSLCRPRSRSSGEEGGSAHGPAQIHPERAAGPSGKTKGGDLSPVHASSS